MNIKKISDRIYNIICQQNAESLDEKINLRYLIK